MACCLISPLHKASPVPDAVRDLDVRVLSDRQRHETDELTCLTPDLLKELAPEPVHRLADRLAEQRLAAARSERQQLERVT